MTLLQHGLSQQWAAGTQPRPRGLAGPTLWAEPQGTASLPAAYLPGEPDVGPGPTLQQQFHGVHIRGLHGQEQDLHRHVAQVGVSASVQQQVDGQPPVPVPARRQHSVTVSTAALARCQDTRASETQALPRGHSSTASPAGASPGMGSDRPFQGWH